MIESVFLASAAAATVVLAILAFVVLPRLRDRQTLSSLRAFSNAIELRFPSYRGRSDEVCDLAVKLGRSRGMRGSELRDLEMAARLRDLGLVGIPYRTLNHRDPTDWTEEERGQHARHPEIGAEMLEQIESLARLSTVVLHHHVRFDRAIHAPPASYILAVVTGYVRERGLSGEAGAQAHLREESGAAYSPELVGQLLHLVERNDSRTHA